MASMTRAELRAELKRIARIGANVSSTMLNSWLYEAVKKLQDETRWLEKTVIFYIREYFTLNTNEGFKLTVGSSSHVINLTTAVTDVSGSQLASYLQSEIQSSGKFNSTSITVSYSTSNRKFTITASTSVTGIAISHPDYSTSVPYDCSYKLFGLTDPQTSANTYTITGDAAPWCTSEYPLPSDFLYVKEVRYDEKSYPLEAASYKDRNIYTGTPKYYYIKNGRLGLIPQPTSGGKKVQLDYYYLPADFASDSSTHPFPETFNYAIIYYAAMLYKDYQQDDNGMAKFLSMYEREKKFIISRKGSRRGGGIYILGGTRRGWDPRTYNL